MRTVVLLIFFLITIIGFIKQTSAAGGKCNKCCTKCQPKCEDPSSKECKGCFKGKCKKCYKSCLKDYAESMFLIGGFSGRGDAESSVETMPVCNIAPLPIPLYGHVAFTTPDNHHLVCGGANGDGPTMVYNKQCFEYNAENNIWSNHSTTEYYTLLSVAVVMSTGSYIFSTNRSNTYLFLPLGSSVWTKKTDLPWTGMDRSCGVAINSSHILLVGARSGGDSLWLFNTNNDVWTELDAKLPHVLEGHACINTQYGVLITGGYGGYGWISNQTWLFDTTSKSFNSAGDFNHARTFHKLVRNNGQIYAMGGGGQDFSHGVYPPIEEWDSNTKKWKTSDMIMEKPRAAFATLNFELNCQA